MFGESPCIQLSSLEHFMTSPVRTNNYTSTFFSLPKQKNNFALLIIIGTYLHIQILNFEF